MTGLPGARSWPGARTADVPPAPPADLFLHALRRRPSGARFRSRGRHAERPGARRAPGVWLGAHPVAPADLVTAPLPRQVPGQVPGRVTAAVREMARGARWAGAPRPLPAPSP
ncbi:hypothetical protein BJF78_02570 [Pseudonocardia sp. CNS-139]|nr:hypothetical protein BJF78_02570 [Pseudonocardia sp. CNS-139]